jgi:gliding motility-associated-like protein
VTVQSLPDIDAGPDQYVQLGSAVALAARVTDPSAHAFRWQPAAALDDFTRLNPMSSPTQDTRYVVEARHLRTHCSAFDSAWVFVLTKPVIPNTFTPNGDGINDAWEIRHLDRFPGCIVEVHAASGTLLFRSVGYAQPWDGTLRGRPLPAGTYYYVVDTKTGDARMTGYVTIIR